MGFMQSRGQGLDFWVSALAGRWSVLLLCSQGCQLTINLLLRLQWMPLGNGSARVRQHVGPVFQTQASRLAAHEDLSDGVVFTNLVIIKHCDNHQDFLSREQDRSLNFCFILQSFKTYKCTLIQEKTIFTWTSTLPASVPEGFQNWKIHYNKGLKCSSSL